MSRQYIRWRFAFSPSFLAFLTILDTKTSSVLQPSNLAGRKKFYTVQCESSRRLLSNRNSWASRQISPSIPFQFKRHS
ncbi:uncharacterized protein LACBIDRAFT_314058 [Laccaria bicolor S238N-H82]|uniref:Predicted protein n=1 Tax=Laccaria bicolor (strain S238N-H82 / ATCC MYA-4686) TaxID=486041 RepID=B0D1H1_LACBS|nr:uncharacterized protein LACBIDRAFT_314058 [Laccaria bicolor S238N-H82]EDR11995.1 predicted protein [Laccaria bicolor S238N-H82]|eukprot:XP_001877892.1 predicted protein [Laccaria bicolor S238N-H82]